MTRAMQTHVGDPAFPVALGRLLAAAPDAGIRDGARAVALVRPLMLASPTLDAGEALAMAMAEIGDFDGAVELQREVIDHAKETGRGHLVAGLLVNLQLYERRRPCRTPWRDEPWYEGSRSPR